MPEMNVLVAASDYSSQSNQPLMKNIRVQVAQARRNDLTFIGTP